MSAKPSYHDLLRRPEWQRKRLKVMERDGFRCVRCGDDSSTLNVHHTYYTKGAMPWDYPDDSLQCLCECCHNRISVSLDLLRRVAGGLGEGHLEILSGFAMGLKYIEGSDGIMTGGFRLSGADAERFVGVVAAVLTQVLVPRSVEGTADRLLDNALDQSDGFVSVVDIADRLWWSITRIAHDRGSREDA